MTKLSKELNNKKVKKPVLIFTIADEKNKPYERMLYNSLRKFHPDVEYYCIEGEELANDLKIDPNFFYRATPVIAEKYMDDYECVIKIDADSIICGDISYIWDTNDYDIATVLNFSAQDANVFGLVQGWGILPIEYVNCGLVAMRSKKFVHDWKVWCFSPQFDRLQYREQDGLNAMIYHGNWNVRILDHGDGPAKEHSFYGLFGKDYWNRAVVKDEKIVIPTLGNGSIPPVDTELKVIHWAGGNTGEQKMQYRTRFQEAVVKRLDYLVGGKK